MSDKELLIEYNSVLNSIKLTKRMQSNWSSSNRYLTDEVNRYFSTRLKQILGEYIIAHSD